jgi:hypothetical protein
MYETSKFNITYYLGAGASAEALPTVKTISQDFYYVALDLKTAEYDPIYSKTVLKLIADFNELAEKTNTFGTPDTYAKYLFLTDRNKLPNLKYTLSAYFLIKQFLNAKLDNRAFIFLIAILNLKIFPPNIKILTWNYDFQLQLAAEKFREERFNPSGNVSVHTPPLIEYYPSVGYALGHDSDDASMVHLNGIAGCYYDDAVSMYRSFFERQEERSINHIFEFLSRDNFSTNSLLTFAFENKPNSKKAVDAAKTIAEKTDILVVIGYSFPFFNRKVDKEIFDAIKSNGRLKTIYYQDPVISGEFLQNQFELSSKIEIKHVKDINNYFLPLEL